MSLNGNPILGKGQVQLNATAPRYPRRTGGTKKTNTEAKRPCISEEESNARALARMVKSGEGELDPPLKPEQEALLARYDKNALECYRARQEPPAALEIVREAPQPDIRAKSTKKTKPTAKPAAKQASKRELLPIRRWELELIRHPPDGLATSYLAILLVLASHADGNGKGAFPGYATLRREAHVATNTLRAALTWAKKHGMLDWKDVRDSQTNRIVRRDYTFQFGWLKHYKVPTSKAKKGS